MWSETVLVVDKTGLRPKIGLGLAGVMLCCEIRPCHACRHNDFEGRSNFSRTIYSFSILCLEHQ